MTDLIVRKVQSPSAVFTMDGGGKVELRLVPPDVLADITKRATDKKVEYAQVAGKAERFVVEEHDDEIFFRLFWDYVIVSWEGFVNAEDKTPVECTAENKWMAITNDERFSEFINESLKQLRADEAQRAEDARKNLSNG